LNLRAVVVDVDGCLTPGEAQPWDFNVFQYVAQLNQRARAGDAPFAVTLCTGRQQPYVEALMQAIDSHLPAIYENGGGLYFPHPYRFLEHPLITAQVREQLVEFRRVLRQELISRGAAQFQPGKELSITLCPAQTKLALPEIAERARAALAERLGEFSLYASVSSVEILPPGIDKGVGIEWLAREIEIPLEQLGGIGDAAADLQYLKRVGYSAAPANAAAAVKANVQYTAPYPNGRGVRDILERWRAR
jgi:HAD superfamily hydrolase (TIGR01484 family)